MADFDCLIVGGGPAGLTAAVYLARFHLRVTLIDAGHSRAALIPTSHNLPGFPDGMKGKLLLARMRRHARAYGAILRRGTVSGMRREADEFGVDVGRACLTARTVLIATGTRDNHPPMLAKADHDRGIAERLIRYCPVCDGFEVTGKPIAVLGTGDHGCREARFLSAYSRDVTLVAPPGGHHLDAGQKRLLAAGGVSVGGTCEAIRLAEGAVALDIDGRPASFATLYPALGSNAVSQLAAALGARRSAQGSIKVDAHQRTSAAGLYAAGDVVAGLHQIAHAVGQASVAAVAIRNDLADAPG